MYQRIVVPLDGSRIAEQALPEAEYLARLSGAPVHLVRVVDLVQMPWYGQFGMAMEYSVAEQTLDEEQTIARDYLETIAKRLTTSGCVVETEIRRGLSSREIVASTKPGDLVVMASHGRSGITRWLLGSVAEDILRHASVPVHLIRAILAGDTEKPVQAMESAATA